MGAAFSLLGPLEVRSSTGQLVHLGGLKPRGLLAMLLVHRNHPVASDRLIHALWGESPTSGASATLRSHVVRVRRLLDEAGTPARLESRSGAYVLEVDPDDVDVDLFERLLADGRAAADHARLHEADVLLAEALSLWRGDVLADLGQPEQTIAFAADLAEKRLLAHEAGLEVQLALGRHVDAVPRLQTLVEQNPFRERFTAQLVLALYRSGRQADALAVAASTRARLADELGLDPGAELQHLEAAVLQQSPTLDVPEVAVASAPVPVVPAESPLVERDDERRVLVDAVARAAAGQGRCVSVAGDAGVGKTALVRAACADGPPVRVLRGQCDPLSTPRPYGPLRDIAAVAGVTVWDREAEVVLTEVCDEVVTALSVEPTVLVVEDLHWVDAATVEVLRFLARRSPALQLSLIVTYRDHEIGPQHPVRPLLGDLARLDTATAVQLGALSVDGVAMMVADLPLDAQEVHHLTGGNPFFVVEVCSEPERPLPTSVRDALLDRTAGLSPDELHVLQLAALAPDRIEDAVLRVLGVGLATLARLETTGLLVRDGSGLAYKHQLARQAVAGTIPSAGEPHLHAALLDALERSGHREPALLTHHAVAALDADRALIHARRAGEEAARSGAHGEAVAFYEVALRHQPPHDPSAQADLLCRLGFEQYLTGRLDVAIDSLASTFELWKQAGDGAGLAAAYDQYSVFAYYDADRDKAEAYADQAVTVAADAGLAVRHGSARATRGFLNYLRGELDEAHASAADAAAAAERAGEPMLGVRAELIAALADVASDDEAARSRLLGVIAAARAEGWDELASTGWSQLCFLDVEHGRLGQAADVLEESIPFTFRRDIPICRHWQTAVRSRVHLGQGDWDRALVDAVDVITTDGMEVARLWPYLITGLLPVRRGDSIDPAPALDHGWRIAESIDEPIRRLSALAVLAEVMWTREVIDARVVEHAVADLTRLADAPGAHWAAGDLAVWLQRLGLLVDIPGRLSVPHAASLAGDHRAAAAWWESHGQPFHAAVSLAASHDASDQESARHTLASMGAHGTLARLRASSPAAAS